MSTDPLEERIVADLKGYRGDGPVRIGNAAVAQNQHDTYGSAILAATPMFFDRRLPRMGDEDLFRRLEPLGEKAASSRSSPMPASGNIAGASASTPIRSRCAGPAASGWRRSRRISGLTIAPPIGASMPRRSCRARCWRRRGIRKRGAFTAAFGSDDLDASVLLLPELGAIEPNDPRFVSTVNAMERELKREHARYALYQCGRFRFARDGIPDLPVLADRCACGRSAGKGGARDMFIDALKLRNSYGLDVGGRASGDQGALGQLSANLFDGRADPERDAAVEKLGGPLLARLVVVSNRVAVPDGKAAGAPAASKWPSRRRCATGRASGSAGAARSPATARRSRPRTIEHDNIDYVVTDLGEEDYKEYYNGFANRVLWPVLHYRFDLAEFSRRDLSGYMRVNEHFATGARQDAAARRSRLGA